MKNLLLSYLLLTPAASAPSGGVHTTFGRAASIQLCRRMASRMSDGGAMIRSQDMSTLVRARLVLENPQSFTIVACNNDDDDHLLRLFVCVCVGQDVHRVDAIYRLEDSHEARCAPTCTTRAFHHLRKWHGAVFPDKCLIPGMLEPEELAAW